jgi:hypothetical protein
MRISDAGPESSIARKAENAGNSGFIDTNGRPLLSEKAGSFIL